MEKNLCMWCANVCLFNIEEICNFNNQNAIYIKCYSFFFLFKLKNNTLLISLVRVETKII